MAKASLVYEEAGYQKANARHGGRELHGPDRCCVVCHSNPGKARYQFHEPDDDDYSLAVGRGSKGRHTSRYVGSRDLWAGWNG